MKQFTKSKIMRGAISVTAGLAVILSGVAFAALQSQPGVLRGNTIQTASANLEVSPNNINFSNSMEGYSFNDLIPGGQPLPNPAYRVFLRNSGSTPLALKLGVSGQIANPNSVNLNKVHIILTSPSDSSMKDNLTLQDLINANSSGGLVLAHANRLNSGEVTSFLIQVSMESDAITGPTASLSNIDLNFGALAVN